MSKSKGLIVGTTEQGDGGYPPDWFCQKCNQPLKAHVTEDHTLYCFPWDESHFCKPDSTNGWAFIPVDNLSYVEFKANDRKISL